MDGWDRNGCSERAANPTQSVSPLAANGETRAAEPPLALCPHLLYWLLFVYLVGRWATTRAAGISLPTAVSVSVPRSSLLACLLPSLPLLPINLPPRRQSVPWLRRCRSLFPLIGPVSFPSYSWQPCHFRARRIFGPIPTRDDSQEAAAKGRGKGRGGDGGADWKYASWRTSQPSKQCSKQASQLTLGGEWNG